MFAFNHGRNEAFYLPLGNYVMADGGFGFAEPSGAVVGGRRRPPKCAAGVPGGDQPGVRAQKCSTIRSRKSLPDSPEPAEAPQLEVAAIRAW